MKEFIIVLAFTMLTPVALYAYRCHQSRCARRKLAEFDAVCLGHWQRLNALRDDPVAFAAELSCFEALLEGQVH